MHRAVIAAASLACLTAGVGQAFAVADGPINEGRAAGTSLVFTLPDNATWTLNLSVVQGSNGGALTVETQRCDAVGSCSDTDYSSPVPAAAVSVDAANPAARLATVLSGVNLAITWSPSSGFPGAAAQSLDFSGDGIDNAGTTYAGQLADVSVKYGDSSCNGSGAVGEGVSVDTSSVTGTQAVDPVSALTIPDGATLACG